MNQKHQRGTHWLIGRPWLTAGLMLVVPLTLMSGCSGSPSGSAPGSSKSTSQKAPETSAKTEPHPDPR